MNVTSPSALSDRLIDAALHMLAAGQSDISLRAVARMAGVSAMAPYRHFEDKTALMAAVAQRGFAMLEDSAISADVGPDPQSALVAQGMAYIAFARTHPALFRLMFAAGAGLALPAQDCEGAHLQMVNRVEQLAGARAKAGALACWALVHGLATLALDGRIPAEPVVEEQALALLAQALAAETR